MRSKDGRARRQRLNEPCHWICLDCGYLVPQAIGGYRDPAGDQGSSPQTCDGCGGHEFGDLRSEAVHETLAVRDEEAELSRAVDPFWSRAGVVTSIVLFISGLTALSLRPTNEPWPWLALAGLAAYVGWSALRSRDRNPAVDGAHPARWRWSITRGRPVPPVRTVIQPGRERGLGRASAPTLIAPLSGRPCLGYEIGIREDRQLDAPEATWLLLEQHVAPVSVAGMQLHRDGARLQLPRTTIETDDRLVPFLRRRGLSSTGRSLVICETILEPGASVEVVAHEGGGTTLVRHAA